jgi:CRISPR-associated endoribonuclease Cas6/Csy4 subtype I-F
MRKYIPLTLIPDSSSGISVPVLMTQVMEKLHQRFVQIKDKDDLIPIGISFPDYQLKPPLLGNFVRIHGEEDALNFLNIDEHIKPLQDYIHIAKPRPVPKMKLKGYVSYARIRFDRGKDILIRRHMNRHGSTMDEAKQLYASYKKRDPKKFPFILMRSKSSGNQPYPLYLKQFIHDCPGDKYFNTFGIKFGNGVEWF